MRGISIVIPNYNGARLLERYVPTVIAACARYGGPTEIIIADDASSDASAEVAARLGVRVVQRTVNGGFSRACNSGLDAAQHELIFFLNSDAALDEDFLAAIPSHFDDPACFAVTPSGYSAKDRAPIDGCVMMRWTGGRLDHHVMLFEDDLRQRGLTPPYHCGRVQGAYFVADTAKVRALGGFDVIYSPYYWEETDLSYRALKRGWHIVYEPRARAYHEVGTTIGKRAQRFRRKAVRRRNRIYFHLINIHDRRRLLAFVAISLLGLLALRPSIWWAVGAAARNLPQVMRRRRAERAAAIRDDATLIRRFDAVVSPAR